MPEVTGKIERKYLAHYIDAALPSASSPSYTRLGEDLDTYSVEMNATVDTTPNILGDTTVLLSGYQKQSTADPNYARVGNPLFVRLQKIIDDELVLDDVKTTVVDVHLWEESGSETGTYVAYREDAIIEVTSSGGDTTGYQIPFNVHYTGNRTKGLFTLSTKTFVAD